MASVAPTNNKAPYAIRVFAMALVRTHQAPFPARR